MKLNLPWRKKDEGLITLKQKDAVALEKLVSNLYNQNMFRFVNGGIVWDKQNPQTFIEKGYQTNADVYSIIRIITRKLAACPWLLYEIKDEKSFNRYKALTSSATDKIEIKAQALYHKVKGLKEIQGHAIQDFIERPNPDQSRADFMENWAGYKLITGNSYLYGMAPEIGVNQGLIQRGYVLPAHYMEIIGGDFLDPVKSYKLKFGDAALAFPKGSVLHSRYWNSDFGPNGEHLYGQSPLRAGARVMAKNNKGVELAVKANSNSGAVGFISSESEQFPLDEEQFNALKSKLKEALGSNEDWERIIPTNGFMKWTQVGLPPADLQLMEGLNIDRKTLCNLYGVSDVLLNSDAGAKYDNVQQAYKGLITNVIAPELTSLRDDLNRWLVEPYNKKEGKKYFLDFDLSAYPEMAADMKTLAEWLEKSYDLTPNEKREIKGFQRLEKPGMDEILVPANVMPLSQLFVSQEDYEATAEEALEELVKTLSIKE